jgi:hypothetical protein
MMCYRDRTWCTFFAKCEKGLECDRALTDKVKVDAERWMKNAPICQWTEEPECFKEIKDVR